MIHLDTHVVAWLASGHEAKVPDLVLERVESDDVAISPMVRLELGYLHEIGRLRHGPAIVLAELRRAIGLAEDPTPFQEVVDEADRLSWTRDPFDRIIAAQALAADCLLATGDRTMRRALPAQTVWSSEA